MLEKFKKLFYEFKNGHPLLLAEEADIICKTRSEFKELSDYQIQLMSKIRINSMYREKYPNAKNWSLNFKNK